MTRVLRRPMFRMGGTTEGITSGLAPRQGYAHEPGHVKQDDPLKRTMPRRTNVYDFMTQMGLNLASTPSPGGIFQQVATAAKEPYAQFQTRRAAEEERDFQRQLYDEKFAFEKEKFGEEKRQFGLELEQDRYLGELAAQGKDAFKEKMINKVWDARIADAPKSQHEEMEKQRLSDIERYVYKGEDISDQFKILSNEAAMSMAQGLAESALLKATNIKTGLKWTETDDGYEEALIQLYKKYIKMTSEFLLEQEREDSATGGRIGYANAGAVMPGQPMQAQAPGPTDQGETNEVNISYEQLRERLPQEISNEIVLLLSQSYEAFADFAEIQTQADVNEFNTKYNVQLFLPKQSGA